MDGCDVGGNGAVNENVAELGSVARGDAVVMVVIARAWTSMISCRR